MTDVSPGRIRSGSSVLAKTTALGSRLRQLVEASMCGVMTGLKGVVDNPNTPTHVLQHLKERRRSYCVMLMCRSKYFLASTLLLTK
jgi:hypothetical protein